MRNVSIGLLAALLFACGGGAKSPPVGSVKLDSGAGNNGTGDMAMSQQKPVDMAMMQQQGGKVGCGAGITCLNAAMSQADQTQCINMLSTKAKGLLGGLFTCLFGNDGTNGDPMANGACNDFNGGVCDSQDPNYDSASCDGCLSTAQKMGGKCYNQLAACGSNCVTANDCQMGMMCTAESCQ